MPSGATGRQGTVTDGKIGMWINDQKWAGENVALRAEGWVGIDVDAYDGKVGHLTIRALEERLGELPVTISSTSRGQDSESRQHFFRVPEGIAFETRFKDVEIVQRSHRYSVVYPSIHPDTGDQYVWYGYEGEPLDQLPAIDDLEELPEAWLEFLGKPEREEIDFSPFGGTVDDWIAKCEPGEPGEFILSWVDQIPKEDFGHDEMVQMQAALVGFGATGKTGVPWALERLRDEWLRAPYNTPEYAMDWALGLQGAIDKYGAFEADVLGQFATPAQDAPGEIDYVEAAGRIDNAAFFATWTSLPAVVTPESLVERVRHVLGLCLQDGAVSRREAVEIAWNATARKHEQCPITSREGVEALAADTFPDERIFAVEEAPGEAVTLAVERRRIHLLTPTDEAALDSITWWGDDKAEDHFMARMAEVNPVMSEQFYRLNRWFILSLIFGNRAAILDENDTTTLLNFYAIVLGPSGIGKSQSLNPVKGVLKAYFFDEDSPDIGGNATEAGLTRALIKRDGRTSFFHSDEADGVLLAWQDKLSAFAGMKQRMTDVWGGDVPAIQRTGAQDISGIHAKAYMCAHLTGIDERILDSIAPEDWQSGFINRFVVAKGWRKPRTREQRLRRVAQGRKTGEAPIRQWYAQWASQFRQITERYLTPAEGQQLVYLDVADDVIDREADLWERFEALAQNSPYPERLRPTFERLWGTVMKCAALVAITKKRTRVEMEDYLIALEQAEEWTENILEMVEATDESPRARQVNRLADLIASQEGKMMKRSEIHARKGYAGNSRDTNGLIDELVQQGRAEVLPVGKTEAIIRLTEGVAA